MNMGGFYYSMDSKFNLQLLLNIDIDDKRFLIIILIF